jgi:hypothetical protein
MLHPHGEPVYRPVLRDAFRITWRARNLWIFAILAAFLLSGSVYDAVWGALNALTPKASILSSIVPFWQEATQQWAAFSMSDLILGSIRVLEVAAFFLIIVIAVAGISVISQGALVFSIGAHHRGHGHTWKEAITVGARAFWPLAVLNLFSALTLWATRSIIAMALSWAITLPTLASYGTFLICFIVFVAISAVVMILHIFALNAMILQGATLAQAIHRAVRLCAEHWVVALETAVILFAVSVGSLVLMIGITMLLFIPLFMLVVVSFVLTIPQLISATLYIGVALFILTILVITAITVQFHYATWTLLYRRFGEGGVVPKLHRWARALGGTYHVPGSPR